MKLRPTLLVLHRWVGVTTASFIVIVALTGCALIFEDPIDRALNPHTSYVTPGRTVLSDEALIAAVTAAVPPNVTVTGLRFDSNPTSAWSAPLSNRTTAFLNPYTGEVLGTRNTLEAGFARWIHLVHTRFLAGENGERFVGWLTVITLLMSLTGLYLWWPRKIVSVGRYRSWRRANFDLHSALGFWASALMVVVTLSGVIIAFERTLDPIVEKLGAAPDPNPALMKSVPVPGERPLSMDEAVKIAEVTLPGARVTAINVPTRATDIYRAFAKFPEDRTPAGRSHVFIDQFSGKVLFLDNTRTAPLGKKLLNMKRSLHTGDVLGLPTQILYFLGSFALAGQVVTGVLIWWKPKRAGARVAARRQASAA